MTYIQYINGYIFYLFDYQVYDLYEKDVVTCGKCLLLILQQVALMDLVPSDKAKNLPTPVWVKYREVIDKHESSQV